MSRRCSTRRAPTIGTTVPARARSQASDTAADVVPSSSATAATASITAYSASLGPPTWAVRAESVTWPPRRYLPDRKPFFSGLHGTRAIPWSRASGASSPSTVRASSEYSTCSAISGVQPRSSAIVWAWAVSQAGVLEKPR